MTLIRRRARELDLSVYNKERAAARTQSHLELPRDATFWRYECSLNDLLANPVYPVWFTDPTRRCFVNYNDPAATRITFNELVVNDYLREKKLQSVQFSGQSAPLKLIVEYCACCEARVVKDGCKRLLRKAYAGKNVVFEIVEVSGRDWSDSQYDMKRICDCTGAP